MYYIYLEESVARDAWEEFPLARRSVDLTL